MDGNQTENGRFGFFARIYEDALYSEASARTRIRYLSHALPRHRTNVMFFTQNGIYSEFRAGHLRPMI